MKKIITYITCLCVILTSLTFIPREVSAATTTYGGYITSALNSGKAIDVDGGCTNDGTRIQIWDFNQTAAQSFRFEKVGSYYKIVHSTSGKVLDVDGGVARDGTRIILWSYHGGKNQKWTVSRDGGYYTFKSALGNYYLSVRNSNTANGTQLQLNWRSNSNSQKFRIQDDITYEYKAYRLKYSDINGYHSAMKSALRHATGISNGYGGVIMGGKVLKYKTITVRMQDGQNVGRYVNRKIKLPYEIQYSVHKHHYQRKVAFCVEDVKVITTCTCGYRSEFSWEVPWPDTSDAQTTQSIIKALPKIQTIRSNRYYW